MATQTQGTVQDILQIISDLRGESTVNTNADRIRAVSRANRDFALRRFWRTHYLKDQTAAGGSADTTIGSASFPMRMKGLAEVFVDGTTEDKRYPVVDFNSFKASINANNAERICYEWYDTTNDAWKVHINPTPSGTITYSYFWEPPTLTTTTDTVVCPNLKVIALLALGDIYLGEDEKQSSLLAKQEAEQIIKELEGIDESPAENQSYTVGAIENSFRNRGFGTY